MGKEYLHRSIGAAGLQKKKNKENIEQRPPNETIAEKIRRFEDGNDNSMINKFLKMGIFASILRCVILVVGHNFGVISSKKFTSSFILTILVFLICFFSFTSISEAFHFFLAKDYELGMTIHKFRNNSILKLASTIFALSADEIFGFPFSLLISFAGIWPAAVGCEIFADICFVSFMEQILKFIFQRRRPSYQQQSTWYCIAGERYSFPSGHTLRVAFVSWRICRGGWLQFLALQTPVSMIHVFLVWVIWSALVGFSRVIRGKHFPLDVLFGFAFGTAFAELSVWAGECGWASIKLVAGTIFVAELPLMLFIPSLKVDGSWVHLICGILWLFSLQYTITPSFLTT